MVVATVTANIMTLKPKYAAQCTPTSAPHLAQWEFENNISDNRIDLAKQCGHTRVTISPLAPGRVLDPGHASRIRGCSGKLRYVTSSLCHLTMLCPGR